ncbi:hypothetical protein BC829DRAFT_247760 [Chytridium lagenaria]|nr:hypothetical protein BC829DRAFT_247760 [Chytridium lagenaria]
MDQLEELNLSRNSISDDGVDSGIQPLFSMKSLRSLHLDNNNLEDSGLNCIIKLIEKGTSVVQLLLNHNEFTDTGVHDFAIALQKSTSIQRLEIAGVLASHQTVNAFIKAYKSNKNLLIRFDNEEALNELVKYEYMLPMLFQLNGVVENSPSKSESTIITFNKDIPEAFSPQEHQPDNIPTLLTQTKSRILQASSQLTHKIAEKAHLQNILTAMTSIQFNRTSVTHNYLNFEPTWPFELGDAPPSVVMMDRIWGEGGVSDEDKAIVREIGLRLRNVKVGGWRSG